MLCKIVFLDRDGTINLDRGYVCHQRDFQFVDRAPESITRLHELGFVVAVITNQSAIGDRKCSESDVLAVHEYLQNELAHFGTCIDAFAYCPHSADDGCLCRKPRTGMKARIERQLGHPIDYSISWTVGDKPTDIKFGLALGTHTALIRSAYWDLATLDCAPDVIGNSLWHVVTEIERKTA